MIVYLSISETIRIIYIIIGYYNTLDTKFEQKYQDNLVTALFNRVKYYCGD